MLLKGLSRPQLLLPAWIARSLVSVNQRSSNSSTRGSNGKSESPNEHSLTLFEELFPEESKESHKLNRTRANFGDFQDPQKSKVRQVVTNTPGDNRSFRKHLADSRKPADSGDVSILALSNASTSLSLSDFLRLSPQGKHIDGWASGIIKVIPGRDPQTLEALGYYFILFSNDAAARTYMDNLIRMHQISKTYTPSSIISPLLPPPGYLKEGEDIHALMQAYTLVPPSQHYLNIRMLKKPLKRGMQRLVAQDGYPAIAAARSRSEDLVLLSLDKGSIGIHDLRAAIGGDTKERNLKWNYEDDIVMLGGGATWEADGAGEPKPLQDVEGKRKRWQPPRFTIPFKDIQEARRFVRAWHRRPFPLPQKHQYDDEGPPIVNAELLW